MAYDNTKLDAAIEGWIKADCVEGFGETYAGDLLASFENYCAVTGALKRSPGRVVFGKCLARREYEKRKVCGLTYWAGILLEKPPVVSVPRENTKSEDTKRIEARRLRDEKLAEEKAEKEQARKDRAKAVRERIKKESKEHNIEVGQQPPADPG